MAATQSLLAAARATDVSFAGLRAQVKRRARLDTLYGWLGGGDVCFLRADGKPWLALVPADWLLAHTHSARRKRAGAGNLVTTGGGWRTPLLWQAAILQWRC